jgi:hypothetical protein
MQIGSKLMTVEFAVKLRWYLGKDRGYRRAETTNPAGAGFAAREALQGLSGGI